MGICSYPECYSEGNIPVKYAPLEVLSCDEHWHKLYKLHLTGKKYSNASLGQTMDKWTHVDKKTGRTIKHKISGGKDWEIKNRVISKDDGKTPINRVTGKPAQL